MRVNELVESTLKFYPIARNSDKMLTLLVWKRLGFNLTPAQRAHFMQLPSTESIRRVRQKLQEQGFYSASQPVQQRRQDRAQIVKQNAPTADSEQLDNLIQGKIL